jgi:hypothetical protein
MSDRDFTIGCSWSSNIHLSRKDRKYLRQLQYFCVMVPVDKAANNIAIICKNEYTRILRDELSSATNNGDIAESVYEIVEERAEAVTARHVQRLNRFYKLTNVPEKLAYLYWMPKLHKVPPSQRFIAAAYE